MTDEDFEADGEVLVKDLWLTLDGGCCDNCMNDALRSLKKVWPSVPWKAIYDEVRDAD